MKQFYVLLILAVLMPRLCSAQDLADNLTASHPLFKGSASAPNLPWEKEKDLVSGHINNNQLSKMRAVTAALVTFFHDVCISDEPVNSIWHAEYFSEKTGPALRIKFGVFCNFYEQKATLSIIANDMSPLLGQLAVDNQDFLTIEPVTAVKNGCPYFELAGGKENIPGQDVPPASSLRSKVWLITKDNQLPYTPVTRKEYLQLARTELTADKNTIVTDLKQQLPVRAAAIQEAAKKAALEQLGSIYSGMELQVRTKMFLKDYQTDEEYLQQNIDKTTAGLDNTLHLMDSLLAHGKTEDLGRPAIVSVEAAAFRGFEDGSSGKMLIRMNPAYFNPYLSVEKPQLFLVRLNYDASETTADVIDRQIGTRLDCQLLKEMLEK